MIRHCAVFGCDTDEQKDTICHYFPEDKKQALQWKNSLNLIEYTVESLQLNYVVCGKHFSPHDYLQIEDFPLVKYLKLKPTALPNLHNSFEDKSVVLVVPTIIDNCSLKSIDLDPNKILTNIDSCLLPLVESHYGNDKTNYPNKFIDTLSDYAVLHKPIDESHNEHVTIDRITEVFHENSIDTVEQITSFSISSSDSDVEVLMGDDMVKSNWSTGGAKDLINALQEESSVVLIKNINEFTESTVNTHNSSSNQNIGSNEFSKTSLCSYEGYNKAQLINIIQEKSAQIRHLKDTLQRFKDSQKVFFQHVDNLREEFKNSSEEFDISQDTIH